MPVGDKDIGRSSSAPAPPISVAGFRREQKKQAKEERDRLKQVEKKKRRLEKALATAAAIRIELEQKKQKRKEEEQRLDEEGAALAEAVALQVLVDEDSDTVSKIEDFAEKERLGGAEDSGSMNVEEKVEEEVAVGLGLFVDPMKKVCRPFDLQERVNYTCPAVTESQASTVNKDALQDLGVTVNHDFVNIQRDRLGRPTDLEGERHVESNWGISGSAEDKLRSSNERAKAAEMAAGIAAAQAVAALRIAEEARAEAEAAKKAVEAAMGQVLDRDESKKLEREHQASVQPTGIHLERDELRARLQETERQLQEKTRQVVNLEEDLENMTQYVLGLKAMLPFVESSLEREGEISERDSATFAESSSGTVDSENLRG
eukprot:c24315_g1_i1 orf=338-1462(+)